MRLPPPGSREVDLWSIERLREHLHPGDCFLDVGACDGEFTLPLALHVGPTGHVIAIEPNPALAARIFERVSGNVVVVCAGAWKEMSILRFGGIGDPRRFQVWGHEPVRDGTHVIVGATSIDTLIERFDLRVPNAIKIDVEGSELEVLEGASLALSARAVLIETESDGGDLPHKSRASRESIDDFMKSEGYVVSARRFPNTLYTKP